MRFVRLSNTHTHAHTLGQRRGEGRRGQGRGSSAPTQKLLLVVARAHRWKQKARFGDEEKHARQMNMPVSQPAGLGRWTAASFLSRAMVTHNAIRQDGKEVTRLEQHITNGVCVMQRWPLA